MIDKKDYDAWFRQFWDVPGASTRHHPAPFPYELAYRLVRMFSFHGDTVLDPFCGTGTTMVAALQTGRNSIGIEIDPDYCQIVAQRLHQETSNLFSRARIVLERAEQTPEGVLQVSEDEALYVASKKAKRGVKTVD